MASAMRRHYRRSHAPNIGPLTERRRYHLAGMASVVLLLPKSGYRNDDFLAAAQRLGLEVILATDVCHRLAETWEQAPLALRFRDAEAAAEELARAVAERK